MPGHGQEDIVLSANGVYKKFGRSHRVARRQLSERLFSSLLGKTVESRKLYSGDFWALQDINLEVRRGEVLGIIGFNGAGKSTLLRLLSGLMLPDNGSITVQGCIGTLIELGAGMQLSLSGKDNIFIKGALLGKTKLEMMELYDIIVEFAELGEFIFAPLSSYSSGMRLRLGFSIAIHMEPDLLLLDEILAVGDYAFRQKCRSRINLLLANAGVVFVSHSMTDIRSLCSHVIVLDNGQIVYRGDPQSAIEFYTVAQRELESSRASANTIRPTTVAEYATVVEQGVDKNLENIAEFVVDETIYGPIVYNRKIVKGVDHYWCDIDGATNVLDTWSAAKLCIDCRLISALPSVEVGVIVWTEDGRRIGAFATDQVQPSGLQNLSAEFSANIELSMLGLNPGRYITSVAISTAGITVFRNVLQPFTVVSARRHMGDVTLPHQWVITNKNIQNQSQDLLYSGR